MDRVVTVLVALGVMPLGLAMMAYLAAREFLLWPFFQARLWGVAVGLIVVGLGLSPCQRFLKAGDHRQKQPHEVGRFVMRLFWLHALGALSVGMGYVLASALENPRLSLMGAVGGGSLGYLVFMWILFAARDPRRVGREMPTNDELARRVKELNQKIAQQKEPPLFFAGHWLPF